MRQIAFIGLGSIGIRHIRNVTSILANRHEEVLIDAYRSDMTKTLPEDVKHLIQNEYSVSEEIPKDKCYDIVFITNPTYLHLDTLKRFANHGKAFFVEKPVFSSSAVDEEELVRLNDKKCYVACPLRYNSVLQYVKMNVESQNVYSAQAISSSYLPDWREGVDYRKTYSAHSNMGGGVAIDLIHEWDYLSWLLGIPDVSYSIINKISDLEIDSNDIAIYIGKKNRISFEVHLDYFGRSSVRKLRLIMKDDTWECDLIHGSIHKLCKNETLSFAESRNEYQVREMEHFLDICDGKIENDSTIQHALAVLRISEGK